MDWLLTLIVAIVGTIVDGWKQVPNWGVAALYLLWTLNKDVERLRSELKELSKACGPKTPLGFGLEI